MAGANKQVRPINGRLARFGRWLLREDFEEQSNECSPEVRHLMGSATRYVEVDAPIAKVYAYWKNFENFPSLFSDVEKVIVDGQRSHWVVTGPAGKSVEWDAEVTEDVPNERISWRSVGENQVDTSGVVRFDEGAPGKTKVTVALSYDPPAGKVGEIVAEVLKDPDAQLERAMDEFSKVVSSGGLGA